MLSQTLLLMSIFSSSIFCVNPVNPESGIHVKANETPIKENQPERLPLEFVIVIPSYNNGVDNGKWIKRNLQSIAQQKTSASMKAYSVNDCSVDDTAIIMDETVKKLKLGSTVQVIHNTKRVGALANIDKTIRDNCKGHEVVVLLDGDDAFNPQALRRLEAEYQDPEVWATYGSFVYYPSGDRGFSQELPLEVWKTRSFRQHDFAFQHLRTFRAELFKRIDQAHLKDKNGNYFEVAWDLAIMLPIAELCTPDDKSGKSHMRYISDILYIYNCNNPISDFRTKRDLQIQTDNYIRSLPPYKPLERLTVAR